MYVHPSLLSPAHKDKQLLLTQPTRYCQGTTRLLLTKIPYFREVILMSFSCDKCGFQNSEVQAAGTIQPKGCRYELRLTEQEDFSRQVVKSDTATVKFIELDVEVPQGKGRLTNVEGLLSGVIDDLELGQESRRKEQPEVHKKIDELIEKGRSMLSGRSFPLRVVIDDPAGNSWIAPDLRDGVGKWEKRDYVRSREENTCLGLAPTDSTSADAHQWPAAGEVGGGNALEADEIVPNEVYSFPASCPGCMHACTTHMKMVDIPHFKQVVLMSTVCDGCGYRSNDVKTGGDIPEKGKRITLRVSSGRDLGRDILKSETCHLKCPELHLEVHRGTLGGRFTTVEGLLTQVRDDLRAQIFETGDEHASDSMSVEEKSKWYQFFARLNKAIAGETKFSIVLKDPLSSSYVQKLSEDGQTDPQIEEAEYDRTDEEEEELGLKDMNVDHYSEDVKAKESSQQPDQSTS